MNSRGQGTIEYLVIIAIVVVISLVVVALVLGIFDNNSGQITGASQQLNLSTQPLAVESALIGTGDDADGLIVLKNNTGDIIEDITVTLGDKTHRYYDKKLSQGDTKVLDLSNVETSCEENETKTSQELKITYITRTGIEKTVNYGIIELDCSESNTPQSTKPPIVESPPLELSDLILAPNGAMFMTIENKSGKTIRVTNFQRDDTKLYKTPSSDSTCIFTEYNEEHEYVPDYGCRKMVKNGHLIFTGLDREGEVVDEDLDKENQVENRSSADYYIGRDVDYSLQYDYGFCKGGEEVTFDLTVYYDEIDGETDKNYTIENYTVNCESAGAYYSYYRGAIDLGISIRPVKPVVSINAMDQDTGKITFYFQPPNDSEETYYVKAAYINGTLVSTNYFKLDKGEDYTIPLENNEDNWIVAEPHKYYEIAKNLNQGLYYTETGGVVSCTPGEELNFTFTVVYDIVGGEEDISLTVPYRLVPAFTTIYCQEDVIVERQS